MSAKIKDKRRPYRPDKIEIKLDFTRDLAELEYKEYMTYLSRKEFNEVVKATERRLAPLFKKKNLPKGWFFSLKSEGNSYTAKVKASRLGVLAPIFCELGAYLTYKEAIHLIRQFMESVEFFNEIKRQPKSELRDDV